MKRARFLAAVVPSLLIAALGTAALGTAAATTPAAAAPLPDQKSEVPHCVTLDGVDLNELYRVKDRIIGPPNCRETYAKDKWVRTTGPWITARSGEGAVYPAGYTPERTDPIDDFNSKFVSATYIQDIGTPQEQRFTYKKKKVLRTGFFLPESEGGLPYSVTVSPPFKALPVGTHTITVLYTLSEQHCDGLGAVEAENCLPEGTFAWTDDTPFTVVPRPTD